MVLHSTGRVCRKANVAEFAAAAGDDHGHLPADIRHWLAFGALVVVLLALDLLVFHLCITPMFLVLLVIESTDVVFAVDSVPAIKSSHQPSPASRHLPQARIACIDWRKYYALGTARTHST